MKTAIEPRFLPLGAAAKWCGLSDETLRRLVRAGRLKSHHPLGRRPALIDLEELTAFIQGDEPATLEGG